MKLIFAGTPKFSELILQALYDAQFEIPIILTQPDRAAGRGMRIKPSPVKQLALAHDSEVYQPCTLKDAEALDKLSQIQADCMIVAAYGLILPQPVLDLFSYGCINVHASLLPHWRGAAPIQRAILAGDLTTGISIMQMDAGLDTGPILCSEPLEIAKKETAETLHDRLATLGAKTLIDCLNQLPMQAKPQPENGSSYADKIIKSEAEISWDFAAIDIDRKIRAFNPVPGARFIYENEPIKILEAEPWEGSGRPGEILEIDSQNLIVACGQGALCIHVTQCPGGRRQPVKALIESRKLNIGQRLI